MTHPESTRRPPDASEAGLQVYDLKSPIAVTLTQKAVREQMEMSLKGSDLNPEIILTDLMIYLTANPRIAALATPQDLYVAAMEAARRWCSFGDGGLWLIPDKEVLVDTEGNPLPGQSRTRLRTQESKRLIQRDAAREGWELRAVLVFEVDRPYKMQRSSDGRIVGFTLNPEADPFAPRTEATLVGAFGIATKANISSIHAHQTCIELFDKTDLIRRKNHSAAAKKGSAPAWRDDPLEMHKGAVIAAMGRLVVPIRVKSSAMVGSPKVPIEIEYERVPETNLTDEPGSRSEALATRLEKQGQEGVKSGQETIAPPSDGGSIVQLVCPAHETFSPEIRELLATRNPVQSLHTAMVSAWKDLNQQPDALAITYKEMGPTLAKGASKETLGHLRQVKQAFFDAAKAGGLPQE